MGIFFHFICITKLGIINVILQVLIYFMNIVFTITHFHIFSKSISKSVFTSTLSDYVAFQSTINIHSSRQRGIKLNIAQIISSFKSETHFVTKIGIKKRVLLFSNWPILTITGTNCHYTDYLNTNYFIKNISGFFVMEIFGIFFKHVIFQNDFFKIIFGW